jgi:hypothetical protein
MLTWGLVAAVGVGHCELFGGSKIKDVVGLCGCGCARKKDTVRLMINAEVRL